MLGAVALAACSTGVEEELTPSVVGQHVVVSASIDGASSRVAMEDAGDYIKVDWETSDEAFIVYGESGTAIFTQTASTEDSPSQFEGTLPVVGPYLAIYPAALSSESETAETFRARYANQHGRLDESLCVMVDLESDGSSFHFQHGTSILRPTFKVGEEPLANNQITRVVVSSSTILMKNSVFGIYDPVYVAAECNALDKIYLHLISEEIEAEDDDRSFDVVVTTADAKIYTGQLTVPNNKTLLPGKFYTPEITLSELTEQLYNSETVATPNEEILGDGTAEIPYVIYRAGDLKWLLENAQGADSDEKHYVISNDFEIESDSSNPWSFGAAATPFMGHIDGQGHTISGELVADPSAFFFGFVGINDGVIENLTIDADVVGSNLAFDVGPMLSGNPDVHLYLNGVGALAGANRGTIDNCTNSGTVSGGTVTAAQPGSMMGAGGLVGFAITGSITNSSNSGNVTGTSTTNGVEDAWNGAGGIVGGVTGAAIDNCSNTGTITGGEVVDGESIAGGLVGYATNLMGDVTISGCTNSGAVNGSTDSATENAYAGGIVGFITDSQPMIGDDGASKIENCTNNGPVTGGKGHDHGDTYTGGIAGTNYMTDIIGCTNTASATITAGDTEQVGNLQGGWIYAGGIVGYLSSHDHEAYTHSVATKVASCKNYAAVNGPLSGDWAFIGGIAGQATSGHMIITETENHGAIDGRGCEHVNSLYVGGFVGRAVGDCTEIYTCVNYGTVKGGTANEGLFTGGIVGDFSGVSTYDNDPRYVSHIYDTVNEASAIVTCGVSLTATPENSKVCYGGIAGEVSQYNSDYYPYYPYVCSCCVDKSNCAGGLIGRGNTTTEVYEHCPNH